ncbi:MAG TPA: hypothetical protein VKO86_09780 [Gemmatimonadales bacterium]|nr:hypothetical protein [Gemmatimonadales bacterium]
MAGLFALAGLGGAACADRTASPTGPAANVQTALAAAPAGALGGARTGFGFNGTVSGFPTGVVFLTGGGSFDVATASNVVPTETDAKSGGGFRCVDAVAQGPLAGCGTGEGVRWDTAQLLASTGFKCTGADAPKTATTGPGTVVLRADFYRAGDGNDESFTATIIVSDSDLAPEIDGNQTLWVQGVGCGTAVANFSR